MVFSWKRYVTLFCFRCHQNVQPASRSNPLLSLIDINYIIIPIENRVLSTSRTKASPSSLHVFLFNSSIPHSSVSSLHPLVVNLPLANFDSDIAEHSRSRCVATFRGGKKKKKTFQQLIALTNAQLERTLESANYEKNISKTQETYALLYRWSHHSPSQSGCDDVNAAYSLRQLIFFNAIKMWSGNHRFQKPEQRQTLQDTFW